MPVFSPCSAISAFALAMIGLNTCRSKFDLSMNWPLHAQKTGADRPWLRETNTPENRLDLQTAERFIPGVTRDAHFVPGGVRQPTVEILPESHSAHVGERTRRGVSLELSEFLRRRLVPTNFDARADSNACGVSTGLPLRGPLRDNHSLNSAHGTRMRDAIDEDASAGLGFVKTSRRERSIPNGDLDFGDNSMVLKAIVKRCLRWPADAIIASSKRLPAVVSNLLNDSLNGDYRVAKCFPYQPWTSSYKLAKPAARGAEFPVPPKPLWMGYGDTPEVYLGSGETPLRAMMDIAEASGWTLHPGSRALDFGCAAGRMTRCFYEHAEQCEIWGVDIVAENIIWCQQHLSPPFRFATVTTLPHLPFEDHYFDLVLAGSVFTHIEDLPDAWLLELRRVLRPGGRIFITVSDRHTIELTQPGGRLGQTSALRGLFDDSKAASDLMSTDWAMLTISRGASSQVFYDIDYLRQHWGRILRVISITPEGYSYQTAVLLTKD